MSSCVCVFLWVSKSGVGKTPAACHPDTGVEGVLECFRTPTRHAYDPINIHYYQSAITATLPKGEYTRDRRETNKYTHTRIRWGAGGRAIGLGCPTGVCWSHRDTIRREYNNRSSASNACNRCVSNNQQSMFGNVSREVILPPVFRT